MIPWIPITFVRITSFFVAGILLGIYLPDILPIHLATLILLLATGSYSFVFILNRRLKRMVINPGYLGLPAIFLAGFVHVVNSTESRTENHIINLETPIQYYTVTLNRFTEEKEKSWKVEARINRVFTDQWENKDGKIVLYFSKKDFLNAPIYGDVFVIKGQPRVVDPPGNPGEFDYKRFLMFKNIYHQHYVRAKDALLTDNDPPNIIMAYAIAARVWANETLKKHISGEREQGVASALVLGVTDGLDNELLTAYAGTGAMHVLAVSGLHITIIYLIIAWFLKPFSKLKSGPWIIAICSLIILWGYAFITGLSPSVLRAVTMFSFLALSKPTNQSTNIYNTLAASAFCLLMFDPFLVMSVGFQLSYLAVAGIVYLHPKFYVLWEPDNRLLDEIWKITSVSIAAQIATLALGFLYFHQFPNYFLLSNLLVIPGSFVVLIGGLAILAFSFVQVVASVLGFLTMWMIKILNIVVFTVESFPFSLIEDIHISVFQCWMLIAVLISIILLFERKRFTYVLTTFSFVIIFGAGQWMHFQNEVNVRKISIYKVTGHSAIDFIDAGKTWFVTDSVLGKDLKKIGFHIKPNRVISGVRQVLESDQISFIREFQGGRLICWNNLLIAQITAKNFALPENLRIHWLIISNNSLKEIPHQLKNSKIILDSSNSYYFADAFIQKTRTMNFDVYSILHQGSFEFSIPNTPS